MTQSHSSALARVLAAPWQQRRNAGTLWGLVFVVLACSSFPLFLLAVSVLGDPGQAAAMRHKAALSGWVGIGALGVVGWAMLVGNVLQQNHPALARLVPGHVGRLRAALLAGWAGLILAAAAGPGVAFDAPLVCACAAAAALAIFAAALRWPVLLLGALAAPFVVAGLAAWDGHGPLSQALRAEWHGAGWLVTAVVVTAGCVVLVAMVRTGGARHTEAFERWHRVRSQSVQAAFAGVASSPGCAIGRLDAFVRPYAWWTRRLLARRDSPAMARVLLGIGPATHWTTLLFQFLCALLFAAVLCGVVGTAFMGPQARAGVCAYCALFALILLGPPSVQQLHRVWQTRREQALLTLLPGVARGPALSRWLAWQMSWPFLLTSAAALVLADLLAAQAEAIRPGAVDIALGGMVHCFAVALLPLVACQWRDWARMREPATLAVVGPVMLQMGLVVLALGLHGIWNVGYLALGIVFALVALAWCAWRWWRMGGEPTALPVGRAAR